MSERPPNRIWLQTGGDYAEARRWGDLTWCEDRVEDDDEEYVRLAFLSPGDQCGPDGSCVVVKAEELAALRKVAEAARNLVKPINATETEMRAWAIRHDKLRAALSTLSEGEG